MWWIIAAYVILGCAFFLAEGKKQTFFAVLGAALSSYMSFHSHLQKNATITMWIYFGAGLLFVVFLWALDETLVKHKINKPVAAILALLFGGIGAHKYYLGKNAGGVLYLLFSWTLIPAVLGVLECVRFLLMDDKAFHMRYSVAATAKATTPAKTAKRAKTQPTSPTPAPHPVAPATPVPANAPVASVVTAGMPGDNTRFSAISAEMEAKYTSVQTALSDAMNKANAITVFGEQEGAELAIIKETLKKLNADFAAEIEKLKNGSEWERFCIAFFGETNAGKSTIIESLRIIYDEESKRCEALEQRMDYYGLMKQHCEDYRGLVSSLEEVNTALKAHYGQQKTWRNYLIIGAVSLVVGVVVGLILA